MHVDTKYPGLFYEITCTDALSANREHQKQYIYLISESNELSDKDPFNNRRLKSVMDEIDIVVFDTPPLKGLNDKVSLEKRPRDLRTHVMIKGAKDRDYSASMNPKQRILFAAEFLGKQVSFTKPNNEAFKSHQEFIEFAITQVWNDAALMHEILTLVEKDPAFWQSGNPQAVDTGTLETHPKILKLKEMMPPSHSWMDDMKNLGKMINEYALLKKKVLFVCEYSPKILSILPFSFPTFGGRNLQIRGHLKEPQGFFWKVKKNKKTVAYLLGSVPSPPNFFLHLNSRINKCFKKASHLNVEIDITLEEIRYFLPKLTKDSLRNRLNNLKSKQRKKLTSTLKKIYPEEHSIVRGINKLKSSFYPDYISGVDLALIKQAKATLKPVGNLQTLKQYDKQTLSLGIFEIIIEVLAHRHDFANLMNMIARRVSLRLLNEYEVFYNAWYEGNLEAFEHSKTDLVMTARNLNMAFKFIRNIEKGQKPFACVDAAYTAGPMNMRDFLHQCDYETVRVYPR